MPQSNNQIEAAELCWSSGQERWRGKAGYEWGDLTGKPARKTRPGISGRHDVGRWMRHDGNVTVSGK